MDNLIIYKNLNDMFSFLNSQYNSDNTFNKRIILEQVWILKKIINGDTLIDSDLKNKIEVLYIMLQKDVFNIA